MSALEDPAELLADVDALCAEDELPDELDEQAASSIAEPAASAPNAIRAVRGFCLLIVKRSMRPRIHIQGQPDHTAHRLVLATGIVNGLARKIRYRFGLYRETSTVAREMLSSRHMANAP